MLFYISEIFTATYFKKLLESFLHLEIQMRGKGVGVATGIYPVLIHITSPITLKLTIRWALLVSFYTF